MSAAAVDKAPSSSIGHPTCSASAMEPFAQCSPALSLAPPRNPATRPGPGGFSVEPAGRDHPVAPHTAGSLTVLLQPVIARLYSSPKRCLRL